MTCQCTCGKHILVDTSNSVTATVPNANAAAPLFTGHVVYVNAAGAAGAPLLNLNGLYDAGAAQPYQPPIEIRVGR